VVFVLRGTASGLPAGFEFGCGGALASGIGRAAQLVVRKFLLSQKVQVKKYWPKICANLPGNTLCNFLNTLRFQARCVLLIPAG